MRQGSADASVNRSHSGAVSFIPARTVALVDAGPEALAQLDCNLEKGCYALMFLDSRMRPHSDIKYQHPSVVVLFTRFDSPGTCQLLTLLRMDPETRNIPVLILLAADDEQSGDTVSMINSPIWAN